MALRVGELTQGDHAHDLLGPHHALAAELLHARRLRRRLERILEVLERSDDPSVEELTQIMEVMRMHETYYTPEQLAQLEARREEVGEDQIAAIERVTAGYGKVAVLDRIQNEVQISSDRIIYVGDGSSDVHVMLHVNRRDGFTIAVSENKHLAPIARRTVLSTNALGVLIPILEEIVGWDRMQIRAFLESQGFVIQEWDKVSTDVVTILDSSAASLSVTVPKAEGARV